MTSASTQQRDRRPAASLRNAAYSNIKIMKTEKITRVAAEAEMKDNGGAGYDDNKEWQDLKERMREGDELVRYSDIDVILGFCTGDEGIALLRDGEVVAKVVLAIVA